MCFPPPFSLYRFQSIVQAAHQFHNECRNQRQSKRTDEPCKTGNPKAGHYWLTEKDYRADCYKKDCKSHDTQYCAGDNAKQSTNSDDYRLYQRYREQ